MALFLAGLLGLVGAEVPRSPDIRPAIRVFNTAESLKTITIYSLCKDREGRLWVGTQDGVTVFSGQRWERVVFPGPVQPLVVRAIFLASDGSLWFGTDNTGIWRRRGGTWTHFQSDAGLPSDRVNTLGEASLDGGEPSLLAGTTAGLAAFDGRGWSRVPMGDPAADRAWVWKIKHDPDGGLWVSARGWIAQRRRGAWRFFRPEGGLPGPDVNDLEWIRRPDRGWDLVASIWNVGLARHDGTRWSAWNPGHAIPTLYPTCLVRTPDPLGGEVLWVGTFDRGLAWFRKGRWGHLDGERGLPSSGIYTLLPQLKPTLLLGARSGGLIGLDLSGWGTLDRSTGLPGSETTAVLPTTDERGLREVWVGTTRGLARWRGGQWSLQSLGAEVPDFINCLLKSREGAEEVLWVGTLRGLVRVVGGRARRLDPALTTKDPQIFALLETQDPDGESVLWAGTQWGLACRRRGRWSIQTQRDGLPRDWVYSLAQSPCAEDRLDLWAGTRGGGIARFHRGHWESMARGSEALASLVVPCMKVVRAAGGRPWMLAGTAGNGLLGLPLDQADTAAWRTYTPENCPLLGSAVIFGLDQGPDGRVFLGTTQGVVRFRLNAEGGLEDGRTYTIGDGLPGTFGAARSLEVDGQGRVWFASFQGLGVLDPGGEAVMPEPGNLLVDRSEGPGRLSVWNDGFLIPAGRHGMALNLGLSVYHRLEDTQFRTQLKGLDAQPSPWSPNPGREFTALPSGRQVLAVWAKDYAGRVVGPRLLAFQVQPPWWRGPWTLAGYGLLLILLAWASHALRVGWLTRRNRELQAQVQEATAALVAAHDELEDRVRERTRELGDALARAESGDRAKAAFLNRMSHELRTPLNHIQLYAQVLESEWAEATGAPPGQEFRIIHEAGKGLELIISDILDFSALEVGRLTLERQPFSPVDLVRQVDLLYAPLAKEKGLAFRVEVAEGLPPQVVGDAGRTAQILKDLVSNAVKFTESGHVDLRLTRVGEGGSLRFEVDDGGPGIDPRIAGRIFQPFEQVDGSLTRRHGGTGLGLAVAKRLVDLMGGRMGFLGLPAGGTRFWVEVELPEAESFPPA